MKKLIVIGLSLFLLTGCNVYEDGNTSDTGKPIIVQECDITGLMSGDIIANKTAEGYRYTGRADTFFCENALVFEYIGGK